MPNDDLTERDTRYTPGPWAIRAERYRYIHVYAPLGGIAHLDTIDGEGMANARLIAAAPELAEALKKLANEASGFLSLADPANHGHTNMGVLKLRIEEARAALSKVSA